VQKIIEIGSSLLKLFKIKLVTSFLRHAVCILENCCAWNYRPHQSKYAVCERIWHTDFKISEF